MAREWSGPLVCPAAVDTPSRCGLGLTSWRPITPVSGSFNVLGGPHPTSGGPTLAAVGPFMERVNVSFGQWVAYLLRPRGGAVGCRSPVVAILASASHTDLPGYSRVIMGGHRWLPNWLDSYTPGSLDNRSAYWLALPDRYLISKEI